MVGGDIVKIIAMENLTGYKEEVNMSTSVERGRKRTNIILITGVILLFAIYTAATIVIIAVCIISDSKK